MILGIVQARFNSTRLPGKVLKLLQGRPMLLQQIHRVERAKRIDQVLVATSDGLEDDVIALMCAKHGVQCFRGSLDDVLDRYYKAALQFEAEHIVRLTGDCPLIDPNVVDSVIEHHLREGNDYTSNTQPPTFPDGLDTEVVRI